MTLLSSIKSRMLYTMTSGDFNFKPYMKQLLVNGKQKQAIFALIDTENSTSVCDSNVKSKTDQLILLPYLAKDKKFKLHYLSDVRRAFVLYAFTG